MSLSENLTVRQNSNSLSTMFFYSLLSLLNVDWFTKWLSSVWSLIITHVMKIMYYFPLKFDMLCHICCFERETFFLSYCTKIYFKWCRFSVWLHGSQIQKEFSTPLQFDIYSIFYSNSLTVWILSWSNHCSAHVLWREFSFISVVFSSKLNNSQ